MSSSVPNVVLALFVSVPLARMADAEPVLSRVTRTAPASSREPSLPILSPTADAVSSVVAAGAGFTNALARAADGQWTGRGVTVSLSSDGRVSVAAPETPLLWVELRWPADWPDGARVLCDAWERAYGELGWRAVTETPLFSPWYFLVTSAERTDGYGVEVQPNALAGWRLERDALALRLDVSAGGEPVELGSRTLDAVRIVCRRGEKGARAFASGRAFCRLMCPNPRLPKEPVYGYNDWYCAYGENTATNFLLDAAYVSDCAKGLANRPYVVMDDGWQENAAAAMQARFGSWESGMGPWTESSARFGMDMKTFCARIAALGARPGLWYRPFRAWPEVAAARRLRADARYFDPTHPALREEIAADIRRFRAWGFKLVKVDYLTYDVVGVWGPEMGETPFSPSRPRGWRDRSRTSCEVLKDLYGALREAAGDDMVLVGCNALNHLAAGLFELQRVGNDTSGRDWRWTRDHGVNALAFRAVQDRAFFALDADCCGLASAGAIDGRLNRQWLDLLGRSGTALFVSWRRQLADGRVRAAMRAAFARASVGRATCEPLDWTATPHPARWRCADGDAAYDWQARELTVSADGLSPQEAVRRIRAARRADASGLWTVRVKGRVPLAETLVLSPEDSGVRFAGADADAALVGGEELAGWRAEPDGTWSCPAPRRADGALVRFEQLWTNGRRAGRSVWPKDGFARFVRAEQAARPAGGPFRYRNTFAVEGLPAAAAQTDWPAAKLVTIVKWTCSRQVVTSFDAATGTFALDTNERQPGYARWDNPGAPALVRFENVGFGFAAPGDWLYDERAGRIRYRPRPGETLADFRALAPTAGLRELVRLAGDPDAGAHVRDVVFENVAFEATVVQNDDPDAPDGRSRANAYQAAYRAPGAVTLVATRNVRFANCRVRHTGGYAFRIADGSMSNVLTRCTLTDLGAGGVFAGRAKRNPDYTIEDTRVSPRDDNLPCPPVFDYSPRAVAFLEVSDCEIADAGKVNAEGVGVLLTHVSDSRVVHNDIHDILYSGVSAGWVWGYLGSVAQRNEIAFNRIRNLGAGVMSDLAGVYTLGTSHGTVVSNNVIANVKARHYGGWGLYADEGTEGVVFENNLVHDTFDGGFHQHYGRNNVVRNNIFAYSDRDQIAVTKGENHLSLAFLGNIVLWNLATRGEDHALLRSEGTAQGKARIVFQGNLWWNEGGETNLRAGVPFAAWQREGNDLLGAAVDPKFVDAAERDFRLRPDSPAFAGGFRPLDVSRAGVRR